MTDKLLITVAPSIPPYIAQGIPGLDLSPEGIAGEVVRAANAGANVVHLHVWDEAGQPTMDLTAFERTLRLIRAGCDIVIEGSTGGVNTLTAAERCVSLQADIELASLNPGSVNYDKGVYVNSPDDIAYWAQEMQRRRIKPDIAIFEAGMIANAVSARRAGLDRAAAAVRLRPGTARRAAGDAQESALPQRDDPGRVALGRGGTRRQRSAHVGPGDEHGRARPRGVRGQPVLSPRRAGDEQRAVDRAAGAHRA